MKQSQGQKQKRDGYGPAIKGRVVGLSVLAMVLKTTTALAGTIAVTTTSNTDSSNGVCSLVEALTAANGNGNYKDCHGGSSPYTITLPSGTITSNVAIAPNKVLTITGVGMTSSIITFGANTSSGCAVLAKKNGLTLKNLTLQQSAGLFLSGVCGTPDSSGIATTVDLQGVRIQQFQNRGVVMEAGTVGGKNILIQNNSTPGSGGGVAIYDQGVLGQMRAVSIMNNIAGGMGGGVYRQSGETGNSALINATISGNQAPLGGGIYNAAATYLELHFCTVVSNSALNSGGGIYSMPISQPIHLYRSVVVSNTAPFGANFYTSSPGLVSAESTDCLWGGPFDESFNDILFDGFNRTIQQATVGTEFSALTNTGAPYFLPYFPLRSTSSAVSLATCESATVVDVRGISRPQGPGCDSGAYER